MCLETWATSNFKFSYSIFLLLAYKKITIVFRTQEDEVLKKINESRKEITMSTALLNLLNYIIPNYSLDDLYNMMRYEIKKE